ncbi:NAD(P)H-hydrate dehydratase [Alteraurantiacibacter palmitatis]|uniref:Bifunctional NAD(P)H-hydrate repair enzyme n=1 Tax=Alteraurantiacibacter palmitatis TaxID=2054628 RepID=A0ABV7E3C1_9SPHN
MLRPDQILTVAQMQAAEQALIDGGETVSSLMERAGAGAADYVWRLSAGRPVTVLCGPGNNGGDGYVIARLLHQRGVAVQVVAPMQPKTAAARAARAAWGGESVTHAAGEVFVDCLFGSGLARSLEPPLERLLNDLAGAHRLRVAVDLPSGVDADSGECLNAALPVFDLTIALGAWKPAHWQMPAMELMGARRLVDIGIAPMADAMRVSTRPHLASPPMGAHKYSRGLLSVVGGAMPGAAVLAARAAQGGGAGYVRIETSGRESFPLPPDIVLRRVPTEELFHDRWIDAVLIGPGLGRGSEAQGLLANVLELDIPTVCDADALHLLEPPMLQGRSAPLIVTPHDGEREALNEAFGVVGDGRIEEVVELAEALGAVVLAKGPDTLIAAPGVPLTFMPPACSWLSTAGTGDVLAGLVASRLAAQADTPLRAAEEACWLHAEAARLAGPAFSAGALVAHLPQAWRAFL